MRCDRPYKRMLGLIACLGATATAGCANAPQPAQQIQTAPSATLAQPRDPVLDLLGYARSLHESTPEARARAVVNARRRATHTPDALSYARLALAFGTPGQRRYTPDEAARYAKRALDADDARWSPAARQYLSDIARLYAQSTRQVQTSAAAPVQHSGSSPGSNLSDKSDQRIGDDARVRRLEAQLDDARRKLRELADIEDHLNEPGS